MGAYLDDIEKLPRISMREQRELFRRMRAGEEHLRNTLIEANLGFVVSASRRYLSGSVPREEVIAEGNVGLIRAVEKYDPDLPYTFTTYAVNWIRMRMLSALEKGMSVVSRPQKYHRDVRLVWHIEGRLTKKLGRHPTEGEIVDEAAKMSSPRPEEAIIRAIHQTHGDAPLFFPEDKHEHRGEDECTDNGLLRSWETLHATHWDRSPEEAMEEAERAALVRETMARRLTKKERRAIELLYFDDAGPSPSKERYGRAPFGYAAFILGTSRNAVFLLHKSAMEKLTKDLTHKGADLIF